MKKPHSPETFIGPPVLHGAYARPTRSRRVRKHRRRFLGFLLEGYPAPSPREQLLVSTTADLMVRINEANAWIDGHGLVDAAGEPAPVLKTYVALLNAFRRNLEVLGIASPAASPLSLQEYLAQREKQPSASPGDVGATNGTDANPHTIDAPEPATEPLTASVSCVHPAGPGMATSEDDR